MRKYWEDKSSFTLANLQPNLYPHKQALKINKMGALKNNIFYEGKYYMLFFIAIGSLLLHWTFYLNSSFQRQQPFSTPKSKHLLVPLPARARSEKQSIPRCIIEDRVLPLGEHYKQPYSLSPQRTDVLTVTPWLAPIVCEGTFDPAIIDNIYKPLNLTIATTVFAVAKYTRFLRDFLETAEQHYMVGFKVHYYIFTDQPKQVPEVALAPGRELSVILVPKFNRWEEISLRRMEIIQNAIEERIHKEADYIYCLDVDMKFHNRWGPEVLDSLVAVIHPGYYMANREHLTYERRLASTAYIPMDQGDFYYSRAMFGGRVEDVLKVTKTCRVNQDLDKRNNLEAVWKEESHLNKYLLHRKPTKLLSPEYLWDDLKGNPPSQIKLKRFSAIVKDLKEVRENV